jgi:hypothetical protein
MKKSELRQLIKEEINKVLKENQNIKGKFWKDDNYYTYDHLLPKGLGDNLEKKHYDIMLNAAKNDKQILGKGTIKKDSMDLPYLELN